MRIRQLFKIIMHRRWLFLAIAVLPLLLSLLAPRFDQAPMTYRSSARVLVKPPFFEGAESTSDHTVASWFRSKQMVTDLLLSEQVLGKLAASLGNEADWEALKGQLQLSFVQDSWRVWESFTMDVSAVAGDPAKAKETVEKALEVFSAHVLHQATAEISAARRNLEGLAADQKADIARLQEEQLQMRKQYDLWNANSLVSDYGQRLTQLESQIAEAQARLAAGRQKIDSLARGEGVTSPAVEESRARLSQAHRELDAMGRVFLPGALKMKEKQEEIDDLEAELQETVEKAAAEAIAAQARANAGEEAALAALQSALGELKREDVASGQVQLEEVGRKLEAARRAHQLLAAQAEQARLREEQRQDFEVFTIVSSAAPGKPTRTVSTEHKPWEMLVMVFIGLCLGACCLLALDWLQVNMRLRNELEELGIPILAEIPRLDPEQREIWARYTSKPPEERDTSVTSA